MKGHASHSFLREFSRHTRRRKKPDSPSPFAIFLLGLAEEQPDSREVMRALVAGVLREGGSVNVRKETTLREVIFRCPKFPDTVTVALSREDWDIADEIEKSRAGEATAPTSDIESNDGVDGNTSPRDDPFIVDTAEAILAARAILSRVPPAERTIVVKALEENLTGGAAGGEGAGTDDPATVAPRPENSAATVSAPAALEWPEEQWLKSDEKAFHRDHGIIAYLRRVWGPLLEQGVVITRPLLKLKDAEAAKALGKYLESNPLPRDLRILKDEDLKELLTDRPKQVVDAMHARAG